MISFIKTNKKKVLGTDFKADKKVLEADFKADKKAALESLKELLKSAPEEGQKFQLERTEYFTNSFGREIPRIVFFDNPDCETVSFRFGPADFKIVNSKDAIKKVIKSIEKPLVMKKTYGNSKRANSSVVGRWPFKITKMSFSDWHGCASYSDKWILCSGHMAWKTSSIPEQIQERKDLKLEPQKKQEVSIKVKPVSMGMEEGTCEFVVMKDKNEYEYYFQKKQFMQLLTLLKIKKPEFEIIYFIQGKNGALGIFENKILKGQLAGYIV